MNPRAEAQKRVGDGYEARVLEPSPPAISDPPWFADDPVARDHVPAGRIVVSPVSSGDVSWDDLAATDGGLGAWCAERWLGAYDRLEAAPTDLPRTRLALHRLVDGVISPARRKANGKIGLRYTRGGFGTPFYGADAQVRVAGDELIVVERGRERCEPITTLAAAADHVGRDALPADVKLDERRLDIDPAASAFLGDWFGFAASVLEELRARAGAAAQPSRVQLWPEHLDMAVELGREEAGARATYGFSPGDAEHAEPYVYVAPWASPPAGELWQATAFRGAELSYAALLDTEGQREAVLEFLGARFAALLSGVGERSADAD
jgi:hypothetical protein